MFGSILLESCFLRREEDEMCPGSVEWRDALDDRGCLDGLSIKEAGREGFFGEREDF